MVNPMVSCKIQKLKPRIRLTLTGSSHHHILYCSNSFHWNMHMAWLTVIMEPWSMDRVINRGEAPFLPPCSAHYADEIIVHIHNVLRVGIICMPILSPKKRFNNSPKIAHLENKKCKIKPQSLRFYHCNIQHNYCHGSKRLPFRHIVTIPKFSN